MSVTPYRTPPARVAVPDRVTLSTGLVVTRTPLLDPGPDGPGLAHLSYADALEVAASLGARLPTRDELYQLHLDAVAAGTELHPLVLPGSAPELVGAHPGDPAMVTRAWCDAHDSRVLDALQGFPDWAPVANAGKHWIAGAAPGRARLAGWWVARVELYGSSRHGPGLVQEGDGDPHNDAHADYGTTTILAWG